MRTLPRIFAASCRSSKNELAGTFDLIVGVNTTRYAHRLQRENELARDIFELLRPAGQTIMIDMNKYFPFFRSRVREGFAKRGDETYIPSLKEYTRPFRDTGFEIKESRNFCWIPHSANQNLLKICRALTPVLDDVLFAIGNAFPRGRAKTCLRSRAFMNKLVLAETQGNNPVRSLLAALEAEFVVCPLEAIQAGERQGKTALILSESQFVALCEAASARRLRIRRFGFRLQRCLGLSVFGNYASCKRSRASRWCKDICLADVKRREFGLCCQRDAGDVRAVCEPSD